jgi:hypothetical protein
LEGYSTQQIQYQEIPNMSTHPQPAPNAKRNCRKSRKLALNLERLEERCMLSITGFPTNDSILLANFHGSLDGNPNAPTGIVEIDPSKNWDQTLAVGSVIGNVTLTLPSNLVEDPNTSALLYITDESAYGGSVIEIQFNTNATPTATVLA